MISLTQIPFSFDMDCLKKFLRIDAGSDRDEEFENIVGKVREAGRPKALYKESYIDEKGDNTVTIEGFTLTSLALRKHLDSIERAFPYIATCGAEVDDIEIDKGDFEAKYWISVLKESMLESAMQFLRSRLAEKYRLPNLSSMNPGSGDASVWPLEQQKYLYSMCGDVEGLIGVRLTSATMLAPEMSLSGIYFPSEVDYQSCQLCHREKCRSRMAPFNQELWDRLK